MYGKCKHNLNRIFFLYIRSETWVHVGIIWKLLKPQMGHYSRDSDSVGQGLGLG